MPDSPTPAGAAPRDEAREVLAAALHDRFCGRHPAGFAEHCGYRGVEGFATFSAKHPDEASEWFTHADSITAALAAAPRADPRTWMAEGGAHGYTVRTVANPVLALYGFLAREYAEDAVAKLNALAGGDKPPWGLPSESLDSRPLPTSGVLDEAEQEDDPIEMSIPSDMLPKGRANRGS